MPDLAPTIPTLAQLAGYGDSRVNPGDEVYVVDIDADFVYRLQSPLPPIDGVNLVKAIFLPGFWERRNASGSAAMMSQQNWFIDFTNGSDANDGLTSTTALKTDAERQRRMGPAPMWTLAEYHLRYLTDVPSSDPVILTGQLQSSACNIYLHSSVTNNQGKTTLASLTADAVTVVAHATNTPLQITANAIVTSWTADGLLNKRCRFTSGANVGGVVWPMADLGAKQARMNECQVTQTFTNPLAFATNTFNPAPTDTFVVEDLTSIAQLVINLTAQTNGTANAVVVDSMTITTMSLAGNAGVYMWGSDWASTGTANGTATGRAVSMVGCRIRPNSILFLPSSITLANCYADDSASGAPSFRTFQASAVIRFVSQQRGGVRFLGLTETQVGAVKSWTFQNGMGVFNNTAAPGYEASGACLNAGCEVWGVAGAGGGAFLLSSGNSLSYTPVPPGVAGYFFIDLTAAPANAWISLRNAQALRTTAPAWDPATSAFTAYRNLTSVLIQATIAGGGFNGQFFDPLTGCALRSL
jgi:hypothetical protein